MTSIDFLNKVHKSLDSQEYSLSYSPAKSKNYMLYCNGNFIGGLFDEELCFVYADSVSELLGQPEPVYCGYGADANGTGSCAWGSSVEYKRQRKTTQM